MGKPSTIKPLFCALPLICAVTANGITRQDAAPDGPTGRTPTMKRLWQHRNERTGSVSIKSTKRSPSTSGQHQATPGERVEGLVFSKLTLELEPCIYLWRYLHAYIYPGSQPVF